MGSQIHQPTNQATKQPSKNQATKQPTNQPTNQATNQPSNQPTNQPTKQPSNQATNQPTNFDHPMKLNQKFEHPTIQAPRRTLRINAYSPCSPNGPFPSISIQSRPPSSTLHQLDPTRPLRSTPSFDRLLRSRPRFESCKRPTAPCCGASTRPRRVSFRGTSSRD